MAKFSDYSVKNGNEKYLQCIKRDNGTLYLRENDIRSHFERDYARILHSRAYRRLKHKTQVFFATQNDHICTRSEHVHLVSSIGYTIAKNLGLSTDLVNAIAIGHDLGHAPFGHHGEEVLNNILQQKNHGKFWHEKNSLRFVDEIETIPDGKGKEENLNLTYAVRDGIVLHCGESKMESLKPRNEVLDLQRDIIEKGGVAPLTWEGCVVKISDKIAYTGRDIEDAISLGMLEAKDMLRIKTIVRTSEMPGSMRGINGFLTNLFVTDLCENSNPQEGIRFSERTKNVMEELIGYNSERIYQHPKIQIYKKHASNVIETIFGILVSVYDGANTLEVIQSKANEYHYPELMRYFGEHLLKYSKNLNKLNTKHKTRKDYKEYRNVKIYNLDNDKEYIWAIVDFIAGMTDAFALRMFNEATTFK